MDPHQSGQSGNFSRSGRSSNSSYSSGHPANTGDRGPDSAARGGGRGRGGANVRSREDRTSDLPAQTSAPSKVEPTKDPISQDLASQLRELARSLEQAQVSQDSLNSLIDLMERLHRHQYDIQRAMRDHAKESPIPRLCHAVLSFIKQLDQALSAQGASQPGTAGVPPAHGETPPLLLERTHIHTLCLGLSSLAVADAGFPFPEGTLPQAKKLLANSVAELMSQIANLGGAEALRTGELLDIHNLIRRLVTTHLLDASQPDQAPTREFCRETFAVFVAWAEKEGAPDEESHHLGKCASQIEMMFDYGLGGLPEDSAGLAKVLEWLLSAKVLNKVQNADNGVPLSSVVNLVKRLFERRKINALDRGLDAKWSRLIYAVRAIDTEQMIGKNGGLLGSFCNLVRVMLEAELPLYWQNDVTQGDKQTADAARDRLKSFSSLWNRILTTTAHPSFARVNDLPTLSNQIKLIRESVKKHAKLAPEFVPSLPSLKQVAARLLRALPQARLADMRSVQTVAGLFVALGYLWKAGLVDQEGQSKQSLLALVSAMSQCSGWDVKRLPNLLQVLGWLQDSGWVNNQDLQPLYVRFWGPRRGGWRDQDVQARRAKLPAAPDPDVLQLEAEEEQVEQEHAKPVRPPVLVGETRLRLASQFVSELPSVSTAYPASALLHKFTGRTDEEGFLAVTRPAHERPRSQTLFPIAVQGEPDEGDDSGHYTTTPITSASVTGATTRTTSTTSSTRITTTTTTSAISSTRTTTTATDAVPAERVATPVDDTERVRQDWWRLLELKGTDASVKLLKLAKDHPELLSEADSERVLRCLVGNGKPLSLKALIEKAGYQPVLSDKLEAELITILQSDGCSDAVLAALKILVPQLPATQRQRLATGKNAPPPKPIEKSGKVANRAELAKAKPLRAQWLNALADGDDAQVDQLLQKDVDFRVSHKDRWVGLYYVVQSGHLDLVKKLLARDAVRASMGERGDRRSESLLHVALHFLPDQVPGAQTDRHGPAWEIFKQLLAWPLAREAACKPDWIGQGPNKDVVQAAIANKDAQALQELLKYPEFRSSIRTSRFYGHTVLGMAVNSGDVEILEVLMAIPEARALHTTYGKQMLPLETALYQSQPQMVRALLKDRRAYREFDATKCPSIVAQAAARKAWDLLPDLLAVPAFAASAGGVDAQGITALMHALHQQNVQAVGKLLALPQVCDAVFTVRKFNTVNSPESAATPGASTEMALDAISLAITYGNLDLLEPLLALPRVQIRLRDDQQWKKELLRLASLGNSTAIIERFNSF